MLKDKKIHRATVTQAEQLCPGALLSIQIY